MATQRKGNNLGMMQGTYDPEEICAEVKLLALFSGEPRFQGFVNRVASLMGLSQWTVRDYLDGKFKDIRRFLIACLIASDGHPGIARLVVDPATGFRIVPAPTAEPAKEAEPELTDVILAAGEAIQKVRKATDPESQGGRAITRDEASDLDCCLAEVERQLAEARAAVNRLKEQRGLRPMAAVVKG